MAKIKVMDFLKDVELNRRSLIQNIREKGSNVDDKASLNEVVSINNQLEMGSSENAGKHEVRFFDADGTLLKTEYVENGGSVTPPPNPNLDSERLQFNRWCSAINDRFDNITHDVDYGASYNVKDKNYHLFCTFNESTGFTPTINMSDGYSKTFAIDWGDGTFEQGLKHNTNYSHTYEKEGDYEIIIHRPEFYKTSTSVSVKEFSFNNRGSNDILGDINTNINLALNKAYFSMATCYSSSSSYFCDKTNNLKYAIVENFNETSAFETCENLVIPSFSLAGKSRWDVCGYISKMIIIDNPPTTSDAYLQAVQQLCKVDKLIFGNNIKFGGCSGCHTLKKLIILGSTRDGSSMSANGLESLEMLGEFNYTLNFSGAYNLKKIILPSNVYYLYGYLASRSNIKDVIVPFANNMSSTWLNEMFFVKNISLYKDFDFSLDVKYCMGLTKECLVNMLNKVKDNTNSSAKTFTFNLKNAYSKIITTYVKLNNGLYEICDIADDGAITILEAFNNKNWTVSYADITNLS